MQERRSLGELILKHAGGYTEVAKGKNARTQAGTHAQALRRVTYVQKLLTSKRQFRSAPVLVLKLI